MSQLEVYLYKTDMTISAKICQCNIQIGLLIVSICFKINTKIWTICCNLNTKI